MSRRTTLALGLGAALVFLGGLLLIRWHGGRGATAVARPGEASSRELVPRVLEPAARREGLLGVIVASGSVDVAARLEGTLERMDAQVGDTVRQGAVLARLDTRALQRELAVAQASLQAGEAERNIAAIALAETQERLKRRSDPKQMALGALSEEELATARYQEQTAVARLRAAEAGVAERKARVEQMAQRLSDATVLAPFDGQVAIRYLDTGAMVAPGRALFHLIRSGAQQVRFAVPEDRAASLAVGLRLSVEVPSLGRVLEGRVENVAPEVDAASRMVLAIASVSVAGQAPVPSGAVVRVFIQEGAASQAATP
ncbi:efflux RND transporter periplasmic adaptor subunit [Corallococcus aberystwythensis]|uniref:Efflux RND transporter periplasmic adaptor subunit n=1 Tax=Corallococcus aberystwythensis TaxID=2316722 RepID=A0A3A8QBZ2_9BACT|nr:efflux RND transporter periplasmic adaptor subunit [Corallococcus aberystwythensis]RKH66126.1 efflux RND transporter periplasmic adaptor subunit [Corallococcus aberystwythensis]